MDDLILLCASGDGFKVIMELVKNPVLYPASVTTSNDAEYETTVFLTREQMTEARDFLNQALEVTKS